MLVTSTRRELVVVRVRRRLVVPTLALFVALAVGMDERGVVVFVLVVVGAVLELAQHPTGMVMRNVIVVVRMHDHGMGVLVFLVADYVLTGDRLLLHRRLHFVDPRTVDAAACRSR
jgi:hypothetical protein